MSLGASIRSAWEGIVEILEKDDDVAGVLHKDRVFVDPDLYLATNAPQIQKTKPEVAVYVGPTDTVGFVDLVDVPKEIRDCCIPDGSTRTDQIAETEFQIVLKFSRRCNRQDVDLELQAVDLDLENLIWTALLAEPTFQGSVISWTPVQILRAEDPIDGDKRNLCRTIEITIRVSTLFPRGSICF